MKADRLLRTQSLADDKSFVESCVFVVFAFAGGVGPMSVAWGQWPRYAREVWFVLGLVVVGFTGFVAMLTVASWAIAAFARRRLRRIGYGFDSAEFVKELGVQRRESELVVVVKLAERVAREDVQAVAARVPGWIGKEPADGAIEAKASVGVLTIVAAKLETHKTALMRRRRKQHQYFDNQPVHRQLLRIAKVLPEVAAAHAIEGIEVEVRGKVVPLADRA